MKVRLIAEDEASTPLPIGESIFLVRRVPEVVRREALAKRRRTLRRINGVSDANETARVMEQVEDDLLDYAVTGWKNLDGDPPCTRENKVLLPAAVREAIFVVAGNPSMPADEGAEANFGSPSDTSKPSAPVTGTA